MNANRPLTEWERRLLLRLLEPAFAGRDALRDQLDRVCGSAIDENGSVVLQGDVSSAAPVEKRIPTEGQAIDLDGTTIHYLLHVVDGKMRELEVYKDDSSAVLHHPDPDDIEVVILG